MTSTTDATRLLNACQRGFPLVARPFDAIARSAGMSEAAVLDAFRAQRTQGSLGRIGAVWARGAGGAGALCAMTVPPADLDRVARIVNNELAVNHNYEREHHWNLWYVITAGSAAEVREVADRIEDGAGYPALFLPMVRAYRVDLGFDLYDAPSHSPLAQREGAAVTAQERPLAALAERGLALVERPYDVWAAALGCGTTDVLGALERWLDAGTLRRFGAVVRHHDVGYCANAMTVVLAPASRADAIGRRLAQQAGVTLAYRRKTDPRWPYNLYFMVHGRERAQAQARVAQALAASGAGEWPHETLFSVRRFKQTGAHYFSGAGLPAEVSP